MDDSRLHSVGGKQKLLSEGLLSAAGGHVREVASVVVGAQDDGAHLSTD